MSDIDAGVERARVASRITAQIPTEIKQEVLGGLAESLEAGAPVILSMNLRDVESGRGADARAVAAENVGMIGAVTGAGIEQICGRLRAIATEPDPVGEMVDEREEAGGLRVRRFRWPLGVVGAIHECGPLFAIDVFAKSLLAGNACVVVGDVRASETNVTLGKFIAAVLTGCGCPEDAYIGVRGVSWSEARGYFGACDSVGGIVMGCGAGLVELEAVGEHVSRGEEALRAGYIFVDEAADVERAVEVCGGSAGVKVLVHQGITPRISSRFARESVGSAVEVVGGMDEAVERVRQRGGGVASCIVTENEAASEWFVRQVTAAWVGINVGMDVGLARCEGLHSRAMPGVISVAPGAVIDVKSLMRERWVVERVSA